MSVSTVGMSVYPGAATLIILAWNPRHSFELCGGYFFLTHGALLGTIHLSILLDLNISDEGILLANIPDRTVDPRDDLEYVLGGSHPNELTLALVGAGAGITGPGLVFLSLK